MRATHVLAMGSIKSEDDSVKSRDICIFGKVKYRLMMKVRLLSIGDAGGDQSCLHPSWLSTDHSE